MIACRGAKSDWSLGSDWRLGLFAQMLSDLAIKPPILPRLYSAAAEHDDEHGDDDDDDDQEDSFPIRHRSSSPLNRPYRNRQMAPSDRFDLPTNSVGCFVD